MVPGWARLQNAFQVAARIGGIVANRQADVELKEASARGGDSFERFHRVARQEISQLIIGQAGQTHAMHSSLGSGGDAQRVEVLIEDALTALHRPRCHQGPLTYFTLFADRLKEAIPASSQRDGPNRLPHGEKAPDQGRSRCFNLLGGI